jgi:hypothetical protein
MKYWRVDWSTATKLGSRLGGLTCHVIIRALPWREVGV